MTSFLWMRSQTIRVTRLSWSPLWACSQIMAADGSPCMSVNGRQCNTLPVAPLATLHHGRKPNNRTPNQSDGKSQVNMIMLGDLSIPIEDKMRVITTIMEKIARLMEWNILNPAND
jgi:hypothetical protein